MADGYGPLNSHKFRVRALFISDLHLGTRACHAGRLLDLLARCDADILYLVGDVVDGWRLKARWHWPPSHDAIVQCLLRKQQAGTRILCIPGNHDEFLRHSVGLRIGGIEVVSSAVHEGVDGRRYLVLHGDEFDPIVRRMRCLAVLGIWVYAAAVLTHDAVTRWHRRLGRRWTSRRVEQIHAFEIAVVAEARRQRMEGVICGHIHHPAMLNQPSVSYYNTGDWVEACTAVVEHLDGRFEMLRWPFDAILSNREAVASRQLTAMRRT
jgi:UDP-2,3-diacylglucosamine pyrophosphatase LpxH